MQQPATDQEQYSNVGAWARVAAAMEREALRLPSGRDRDVLEAWAEELRARCRLRAVA